MRKRGVIESQLDNEPSLVPEQEVLDPSGLVIGVECFILCPPKFLSGEEEAEQYGAWSSSEHPKLSLSTFA